MHLVIQGRNCGLRRGHRACGGSIQCEIETGEPVRYECAVLARSLVSRRGVNGCLVPPNKVAVRAWQVELGSGDSFSLLHKLN
jgi:hypothetical protein